MIVPVLMHPGTRCWSEILRLSLIWDSPEHRQHFIDATTEWGTDYQKAKIADWGVWPPPLTDAFLQKEGRVICFLQIRRGVNTPVCGISGFCPLWDGAVFLRWHGVIKKYRGQKIGSEMLNIIIDSYLRPRGITELYELSESDEACAYFVRQGFTLVTDPAIISTVMGMGGDFKYVLCRKIESRG